MTQDSDNFNQVIHRMEAITRKLDAKPAASSVMFSVIAVYWAVLAAWIIWMVLA